MSEHCYPLGVRPLRRMFVVQVLGEPRAAARRAAALLGTQRAADGGWVQLRVAGLGGGRANLCAEAGRSVKQQKGGAGLRKLLRALRVVLPEGQLVFANKGELILTRDCRPLS